MLVKWVYGSIWMTYYCNTFLYNNHHNNVTMTAVLEIIDLICDRASEKGPSGHKIHHITK